MPIALHPGICSKGEKTNILLGGGLELRRKEENARLHKKGSYCPNYGAMCQFVIFRW